MRNILVFPDGNQHDFLYPTNREIEEGERLQVHLSNSESIHVLTVKEIQKTEKAVFYLLDYA
ncbi:hypothetical protein [Bacillus atrophaeus]|uniref:hypothetical protein n=1 Tax=Bacillus atrophaeus TaxID=1452 RepID=UPI001C121DF1|nr:hypothetical protein [Bacillus atrophaeus]MBU5262050.1 hypothetical protein [Bacillus atrophaeus]MCY8466486.1 hypothetical protein [Bacillus atrophaeus]MCY8478945.1 hypothetical protein [Bacillus atrophaeus]